MYSFSVFPFDKLLSKLIYFYTLNFSILIFYIHFSICIHEYLLFVFFPNYNNNTILYIIYLSTIFIHFYFQKINFHFRLFLSLISPHRHLKQNAHHFLLEIFIIAFKLYHYFLLSFNRQELYNHFHLLYIIHQIH